MFVLVNITYKKSMQHTRMSIFITVYYQPLLSNVKYVQERAGIQSLGTALLGKIKSTIDISSDQVFMTLACSSEWQCHKSTAATYSHMQPLSAQLKTVCNNILWDHFGTRVARLSVESANRARGKLESLRRHKGRHIYFAQNLCIPLPKWTSLVETDIGEGQSLKHLNESHSIRLLWMHKENLYKTLRNYVNYFS